MQHLLRPEATGPFTFLRLTPDDVPSVPNVIHALQDSSAALESLNGFTFMRLTPQETEA
ncbi:hypothetical protein K7432_015917 [Basidiobolus ranarum]|uniref:Uncharacterized protein n=1 Tax=Basidiobolus ranarum TaxID=34480 RepID=A0ABR2VN98_9FUNG